MKPKKRVARRGKVRRLRASASDVKTSAGWMAPELYKPIKKPVTLRLDADVLLWFKKQGRGYQTRINKALRSVMLEERKGSRE